MAKRTPEEITEYLRSRDEWIRLLVDDIDMPHTAVRVGLHIAMRINAEERDAWPSTKTIAKMTGVSVRSVIASLDMLERNGYLLIHRKRNVGNRYWLRFKWLL